MKSKIFLSLIALLLFVSCNNDDNVNNTGNSIFFGINGGTGDGYDLLLELDNPNLIGVVDLAILNEDVYRFDFDGTPNYTPYQGTSFDVKADIANSNRTAFVSLKPADIFINYYQMQEYATGQYYIPGYSDVETYFGSGYNKILIDSNQYFDKLEDSITFSSPVSITNISLGDVIVRNQNFVINIGGASTNSLIEYNLSLIDRDFNKFDTVKTHIAGAICGMMRYNGQIEIPIQILNELKSGFYDLVVTAYEPKYVELSNGKQICMLGRSIYAITIQIAD